jgi:hypothetical protein
MRPRSVVAFACVLLPLSLAVAACEPRTATDTSRKIYCQVLPDAPARNNDNTPTKIIGTVRFRCDQPGAGSMALTIHLQRQNASGDWVDVVADSFTVSGEQTTRTGDESFRTREVQANCGEGTYRTYVNGTSQARGVTQTYDRSSPRAFHPCRVGLLSKPA